MDVNFLLNDVEVRFTDALPAVEPVQFRKPYLEANDEQFYLSVQNVGEFYSENGNLILIKSNTDVDQKSIELYLNGSVLGSILHQRKIFALHGSSFKLNDQTVIICGHSGFGKSSLTLAMCKDHHATFLTDDITPISNGTILPISEKLKLWRNSLEQLGISSEELQPVHDEMDKFYLEFESSQVNFPPDIIFIGETYSGKTLHIEEIKGTDKFEHLFANQYWEELTSSMEQSRNHYFQTIVELCNNSTMFLVKRPQNIEIRKVSEELLKYINDK